MRFAFWKSKKLPALAPVDEAALLERVNKIMPILEDAMWRTFEREPNRKKRKRLIALFKQTAEVVEKLTGQELAAFLDLAEASCPDEFKHLLQ
jgi:hypothetical protein